MKKQYLAPLLLVALLGVGCAKQAVFRLNEPFNLQLGERAVYADDRDTGVQFVRVKEDSRCPRLSNCVWEGQAVVVLAIGEEVPIELEFILRPGGGRASQRVGGFVYELQALNPYPALEQQEQEDDKTKRWVTLMVQREARATMETP